MKSSLRGLLIFSFFFILTMGAMLAGPRPHPAHKICFKVAERIYLEDSIVKPWLTKCLSQMKSLSAEAKPSEVAHRLEDVFSILNVSHLSVFNAEGAKALWTAESRETGIEARFVDGELVVITVAPQSPAAHAGLRRGDEIISLNEENPSEQAVALSGGVFQVRRGKKHWPIEITPAPVVRDQRPQLQKFREGAVLKIPSLRAEFFERKAWQSLVQSMSQVPHLVLDLRGNVGGNFVAGLRLLSSFLCEPRDVGALLKPRGHGGRTEFFSDDLADEIQLAALDRVDRLNLKTFADYGCFPGQLVVLIDGGTASTAEMVAAVLQEARGARILGAHSAGQLLVGVWYDVPELGPGWQLSIPEALVQTSAGRQLELAGLHPEHLLFDDLREIRSGRDSWVDAAFKDFRRDSAFQDSAKGASK